MWFGPTIGILITVVGVILLVLSVVGFWIMGARSKVPMWLQLPMFGSPRLYVQGEPDPAQGGDPARDTVLPRRFGRRGEHEA